MRTNVEWIPYKGWLSGQLGAGWVTGNVRDQTARNPQYWLQSIGRKTVTVWIENQDFESSQAGGSVESSTGQITKFNQLNQIGDFIRNNCDRHTNLIIHYNLNYPNNKDRNLMYGHDTRRYNLNIDIHKFIIYKNGFGGHFDFNTYYQNIRSDNFAVY